ncbi:MAG: glycosyltransferase family 2 protein [Rikenellaceae bacterium]
MISIAVPAYNAARYIRQMVESILAQSYSDWELIVVDDCSTDATVATVLGYSKEYSNIRVIKRDSNSGGCRRPRFDGILAAKGEFVCSIDADDFVESDFLLKLLNRQQETGADIVLDRMVMCDEQGAQKNSSIPKAEFDMSQILTGREAVKMTIGGWEIAMAGMLVCRELFQEYVSRVYNESFNGGYADEIDHRKLLLTADKVAMVDAQYFYRMHPQSITHDISIKSFDSVIVQEYLYNFVEKNFADTPEVIAKAQSEYIESLFRAKIRYLANINSFTKEQRVEIRQIIESYYTNIKRREVTGRSKAHKLLSLNIFIFNILSRAVLAKINLRRWIFR